MELIPGFSLYRGLYEFSQYAFIGNLMGTSGMKWRDLSDSENGLIEVLIIMFVEWLVLLPVAFYLDQILGGEIRKDPLFFLDYFQKKSTLPTRPGLQEKGSKVFIEMDRPDVSHEVSYKTIQNSLSNVNLA